MSQGRSREDIVAELQKLFRWVREELDSETCVMWQMFLSHDMSLDGHIDAKELDQLLREFDSTASDERLQRHKDQLVPDGGMPASGLSFVDLCMWWHKTKHAREGEKNADGPGVYGQALLKAKYLGQLTASVTWDLFSDDTMSKRIKEATLEQLKEAVHEYRRSYYELKMWKAEMRREEVFVEEKAKVEAATAKAAEGQMYTPVEIRQLRFLFDALTRSSGKCRIDVELPQLCAVLRHDVAISV
eukprot:Hpha_TRINITY_DN3222_c0_g1::TRINITY_DN3222_c0_g1_i1::g.185935::m.185935